MQNGGKTMKKTILSLLLLSAAFAVTPASANYFSNPAIGMNLNVGSAPNPTPADLRENRLPIVTKDEDNSNAAAAEKTASADTARSAPAPAGGTASIAAASPSR